MRRRRQRQRQQDVDIDVTAFMNLMVVLIPFLLLSAAFNQLNAFDIFLPDGKTEQVVEPKKDKRPDLSLSIRADYVQVNISGRKPLEAIPYSPELGLDHLALQEQLKGLKQRYPEITQITLLAEADTAYARIIMLMDKVRAQTTAQGAELQVLELFPDIALGDAPALKGGRS